MLINNIELDVKTKCIEESTTQAKVADTIGTSKSYVSRIVNGGDKIVNKMFITTIKSHITIRTTFFTFFTT